MSDARVSGADQPAEVASIPEPRKLREYQIDAVKAVEAEWDSGLERTSVVLPTGTGKTSIMASIAARARARGQRVVAVAHRDELIRQISGAVQAIDPAGERVGVVKAAENDYEPAIVVASVQTLARSPKRIEKLGHRDIILCDEAHHWTAKTFMRVLNRLGLDVDPDMGAEQMRALTAKSVVRKDQPPEQVACGFTATMTRSDRTKLGAVWSTVAFERDMAWAIDRGYLIEPRGLTVQVEELNTLAAIKTVGGDYKQSDLDDVMRSSLESTVDAVVRHVPDRSSLVFAASVEHAEELAEALTAAGIPAESIVGDHSREVREERYERFNNGTLKCLVTVQVLTEGADFPRCDCVVLARPTRSEVLLTQIVGRAVRPWTNPVTGEKKADALVVDLTGITRDTKLRSLTDLWPKAATHVVDAEGNDIPEEVEPAPKGPGKERTGRIELESTDLMSTITASNAVMLRSPAGITFIPGGMGSDYSHALWPPDAEDAERVYLLRVPSGKGAVEAFRDAEGNPVHADFASAVEGALAISKQAEAFISRRAGWRRGGVAPSDKQVDFARKLGVNVTRNMSKADVSDAIECKKLDRTIARSISRLSDLT